MTTDHAMELALIEVSKLQRIALAAQTEDQKGNQNAQYDEHKQVD